jgi:hypothetical protein
MARKNRKKADTYRFNGYPHLDPQSIHPVTICELQAQVAALSRKLADPSDADDKKWVTRWLNRYEAELAKKRKGLGLKRRERSKILSANRCC